LSVGIA